MFEKVYIFRLNGGKRASRSFSSMFSGVTLTPLALSGALAMSTDVGKAVGTTFSSNANWFLLAGGLGLAVAFITSIAVGFSHFGRRRY